MSSLTKRSGMAAVLSLAVAALTVPQAHGQSPFFQVRPGLSLQQAAFNVAVMGQALQNVPPYAFGVNPYPRTLVNPGATMTSYAANPYISPYASLYGNPYTGGDYASQYGYPYGYSDPNAASLYGSASVINSQGKFMVSQQQAFLMQQQYRTEQINNRRRLFDEYLYEREKMPTPEEERQRTLREQLDRSRNNPPITEVYSAKALNALLDNLRKNMGKQDQAALRTFPLPLDEAALKHINLSKGTGSLALLKNDGRLTWPVALSGAEFKEERTQIDALANDALRQAGFGNPVDSGTLKQLINDSGRIRKELRRTGSDLTPSMYIEASTFLNNLDDAIKALQQPDVSNYVNGKFAPKAKTVPDLVKFMADNGLRFAPSVPGDENAYVALHQALAAYDRASQSQTAER